MLNTDVAQILSQRDPRWNNHPFGNSTVGMVGCTVTSLASLLSLTPLQVIERLSAVNGFKDGNLIIWAKIQEAFPGVTVERVWSYDEARVNANLPCLVEVDFDGTGRSDNRHWVVANAPMSVMDPWTGTVVARDTYPIRTGFAIVKLAEATQEHADYYRELDLTNRESMKVAVDAWHRVKNGELVDKAQYEMQASAASQCQTQLKSALDQATSLQNQVDSYISQGNSYKVQLDELQRKYEESQRTVINLKAELETVHKEDKDYGVEALEAQHLANEREKSLHMIADALEVKYNPADNKKLVEDILAVMAEQKRQLDNAPYEPTLLVILKQLESLGINNYLAAKGLTPIAGLDDPQLVEKLGTYFVDVRNELLNGQAHEKVIPNATPASEKKPRKNLLLVVLGPLIRALFVSK